MTLAQMQSLAVKHAPNDPTLQGEIIAAVIAKLDPSPKPKRTRKATPVVTTEDKWRSYKGAGPRQRSAINRYERELGCRLSTKKMFAAMTKGEASDLLASLKAEAAAA